MTAPFCRDPLLLSESAGVEDESLKLVEPRFLQVRRTAITGTRQGRWGHAWLPSRPQPAILVRVCVFASDPNPLPFAARSCCPPQLDLVAKKDFGTDRYRVAVPALKALSVAGSMREADFLALVGSDRKLLADLVSNNIVSTVQGAVEFQSRAAQFYVEQLPPPPSPPPWGWRRWVANS